ncbi:hypothetical protein JHK87_047306 [Glycine soja]|nr:hypothetical protein JHK87_047306 [Glycine soja]
MPVPLAPYPTPPAPYTPPANGVQSQLVCSGCRNLLVFPVGATSVCCAVCNAVTAVPPPAKSQILVCDRHRNGPVSMWRLPYFTHVHPGRDKCAMFMLSHCQSSFGRMLLAYQYGARSVKCAVCNFVTSVGATASTTEQKFST